MTKIEWDLAEWLERLATLAVNAKVATVQGSIPASSDTVESEGGRWSIVEYRTLKRKEDIWKKQYLI